MTNQQNSANSTATWIWYPGDYEIWLGNKVNNRRTDRGAFFPPFWKQDSHYVTVEFSTTLSLAKEETVTLAAEGKYNIKIDGKMLFGMPSRLVLPAGEHKLNIKVWNQLTPPALFVEGETVHTDGTWKVTNEDKEWIDDSGKASDTSASVYMDAGYWNFNTIDELPSQFKLTRQHQEPVAMEPKSNGRLYDFGKETFGYLHFDGVKGTGIIYVYYGESAEETQDKDFCETLDQFEVKQDGTMVDLQSNTPFTDGITPNNKAFRYVYIECDDTVTVDRVSMEYEYLPVDIRGSFKCNDEEVNQMWNIGIYTLHLTTREFFIDGIKRDRWTWSGDAYQSYLMNYYLFFNSECVKRTTWQLRGKDPVTAHINTIMDYTFYWFMGIYDYYLYTGDAHFVTQIYPRMQTLMEYVLGRTNSNGMVEGQSGDWVFVDWSPKPMSKQGELSFEQILLCKSLETMALCAEIAGEGDDHLRFERLANHLRKQLLPTFWDATRHALVHSVPSDCRMPSTDAAITRYANMFAIFFDYLDEQQKKEVMEHVLHNDAIMPITTPYMRFYEMEAMCKMGEQADVLRQMKDYWGGMIRNGATTFWEAYDPNAENHLSMYGRPYGKSLCHAWGASPIYLLGRYFMGVEPTKPGYEEYDVRPSLGGLKWIEGSVPTPNGAIVLRMDENRIIIKSTEGLGHLHLPGRDVIDIPAGEMVSIEY